MRLRTLAILLLLAPCATRADFAAGMAAFDKADYGAAMKEWVASGRTGDTASLLGLGRLFAGGLGVTRDPVRAHVFFNLAAFRGDKSGDEARAALEASMSPAEVQRAKNDVLSMVETQQYVPPEVVALAAELAAASPKAAAKAPAAPAPAPAKSAPAAPAPAKTAAAAPAPAPAAKAAPVAAAAPSAPAPALAVARACNMQERYRDQGSGGQQDLAMYEPVPPPGYAIVGGYAQGNYHPADGCALAVKPGPGAPANLLAPPADWQLAWTDKGSGANKDGSVWVALPPGPDHVCIGAVGQAGYAKPAVAGYACVHRCATRTIEATAPIWTDAGTGADQPLAIYRLHESNSFAVTPNKARPSQAIDIDPTATCAAP